MRLILKTAPHDKAAWKPWKPRRSAIARGRLCRSSFSAPRSEVGKLLGDKQSLAAFGYAGWASGQLEGELARKASGSPRRRTRRSFCEEDRESGWENALTRQTQDV